MDKQQKEALMDQLLVFMNEEVEELGRTPKTCRFDFRKAGTYAVRFMTKHSLNYEELMILLNMCTSRGYLKQMAMTGQKYTELALTDNGQGRAISAEAEKHAKPIPQQSGNIHIGTLNAHGSTQVGNYNTQTIENVFTAIIEQIDQTDAPETEKQEAKNRLKAFLQHPLTSAAIGASATALTALCGGG